MQLSPVARATKPPTPRGPRRHTPEQLTPRQRHIVEEAARASSDVIAHDWQEAVADRANKYVIEPTWRRLFKSRRRQHCRVLADIATAILAGKTKLHDLVGSSASWFVSVVGWTEIEQRFARELASKIPLPLDAKMIATARGVQVTGILLCSVNGDDLTRCQCFIDLALSEAKTNVRRILVAATDDWTGLGQFRPRAFA